MQHQPNRRHGGDTCRQSTRPTVTGDLDGEAFEDGRDVAALEMVSGYMAAIDALHPDDTRARQWYRARLDDARTIAGLESL
jgi:hypothetical protein